MLAIALSLRGGRDEAYCHGCGPPSWRMLAACLRVWRVSRDCELGVVVLRCDEVGGIAGVAGESWRKQHQRVKLH
jgi:hypothetical protein